MSEPATTATQSNGINEGKRDRRRRFIRVLSFATWQREDEHEASPWRSGEVDVLDDDRSTEKAAARARSNECAPNVCRQTQTV
jgi:hypothetical protein